MIPLVQLEYRDWSRSLPENNLDTVEDYSFFAPGYGLRITVAVSKRIALSAKFGIEYTVSPRWDGSGNAEYLVPPASVTLGSGSLWQGGLELDYMLTSRLALKLLSNYSHFGFGHSQTIYYNDGGTLKNHDEPDSSTDQNIVQAAVAWAF